MGYKCFSCGRKLKAEMMARRIRCDYCGSRIVVKERAIAKTVLAR